MNVTARLATRDDLDELVRMYDRLALEMDALHPMWMKTDGLGHPVEGAFAEAIGDPDAFVVVGEIDDVPFGFLMAWIEPMLPHVDESLGAIRFVFTEPEAREVGVAESMRDLALARLRDRGIVRFDAHVLPGHRLVKNFFEAGGFSARSIVMHHDDTRT